MDLIKVVPKKGGWDLLEDVSKPLHFQTEDEAARVGRLRAREVRGKFQLRGKNGQIKAKHSYSKDPRNIKG